MSTPHHHHHHHSQWLMMEQAGQISLIQVIRFRAQKLRESRGGRPGLPSLISLRFCGRKATLNQKLLDRVFLSVVALSLFLVHFLFKFAGFCFSMLMFECCKVSIVEISEREREREGGVCVCVHVCVCVYFPPSPLAPS